MLEVTRAQHFRLVWREQHVCLIELVLCLVAQMGSGGLLSCSSELRRVDELGLVASGSNILAFWAIHDTSAPFGRVSIVLVLVLPICKTLLLVVSVFWLLRRIQSIELKLSISMVAELVILGALADTQALRPVLSKAEEGIVIESTQGIERFPARRVVLFIFVQPLVLMRLSSLLRGELPQFVRRLKNSNSMLECHHYHSVLVLTFFVSRLLACSSFFLASQHHFVFELSHSVS
mmetsp:Transcript_119556/g.186713  ORF Transcript_119556/g.186713 Transcript_119556/m.186713 type:complete len:234 (+) Transcript_119556:709-1410(+)